MSATHPREEDARPAAIKAARAHYDADAAPVLDELRAAGFEVASVGALYSRKLPYRAAIPVLVAWLPRIGNPLVKEEIVRALAVKWATKTTAGPLLVAEFERAADAGATGLSWTAGNALEVLANDALADDLIRLATDRRYGKAREMVVLALGKLRAEAVGPQGSKEGSGEDRRGPLITVFPSVELFRAADWPIRTWACPGSGWQARCD